MLINVKELLKLYVLALIKYFSVGILINILFFIPFTFISIFFLDNHFVVTLLGITLIVFVNLIPFYLLYISLQILKKRNVYEKIIYCFVLWVVQFVLIFYFLQISLATSRESINNSNALSLDEKAQFINKIDDKKVLTVRNIATDGKDFFFYSLVVFIFISPQFNLWLKRKVGWLGRRGMFKNMKQITKNLSSQSSSDLR